MDAKKLQLAQLSKALMQVQTPVRPTVGWIHTIRKTIGMTTRQLAERMGVGQSTVVALEQSEADGKITLRSLQRAAEALDCELRYVLVPRQQLHARVEQQASNLANRNVSIVAHTMSLEAQEPSEEFKRDVVEQEKARILEGRWGKLWDR